MIRILFIARYRDASMNRKVDRLIEQPDLILWHICPRFWKDELVESTQSSSNTDNFKRIALPMIGSPADPHRSVYRSFSLGLRRLKPHIIHAEEEPDSLAALQISVARRLFAPQAKLILYTWQNINRPRRVEVRSIMRATLRASDAVLCPNQEALKVLHELNYSKITQVLPAVGVDTQTFFPRQEKLGGTFTIGYAGRLVIEKGIDTLIDAVSQIRSTQPNIRLKIIGSGTYQANLEAQVAALQVNDIVEFTGSMPAHKIAEQLLTLDTLVLPSRTTQVWKEQFGRILVEAMACQVPVIGSDSGAIPEVIGDTGLIFPEGNVSALAENLQRLIRSSELRQALAKHGYDRVMKLYTQEHLAQQTADFYRRMLAEKS